MQEEKSVPFFDRPSFKKTFNVVRVILVVVSLFLISESVNGEGTSKQKFYSCFGYTCGCILLFFSVTIFKSMRGSSGDCKMSPFVPYVEYMDRLYKQDLDVHTYVDKNGERFTDSKLHPRLKQTILNQNTPGGGSSGGTALLDASGVHALFDRLSLAVPQYVSRLPAMVVGAMVFIFIAFEGYDFSMKEKKLIEDAISTRPPIVKSEVRSVVEGAMPEEAQKTARLTSDAMDVLQQFLDKRWMVYMIISLMVASFAASKTTEGVYRALLLRVCKNRKHMASVQFMRFYANSIGRMKTNKFSL
jgi:hypothetical protein